MVLPSIPVDLANPGQVFACLGFLEAANALLGSAEGGFAWASEGGPRFELRADGGRDPFRMTLEFLKDAEIRRLVPRGYVEPTNQRKSKRGKGPPEANLGVPPGAPSDVAMAGGRLCVVDTFPSAEADRFTLPVRLSRAGDGRAIDLTHWCDGSSRNPFKLFAGQQGSAAIVEQMRDALRKMWDARHDELVRDPFGQTVPLMGSSFKLDARKAWTAIGVGFCPSDHGMAVESSPLVELLAAVGLEHARPDRFDAREVRYAAWQGLLSPMLARAALGGVGVGVPRRTFRFTLDSAGENKVVTSAREEINP